MKISKGSTQKTKVPSNSYLPPTAIGEEEFKNLRTPNERKGFRFEDPILFTLPPLPEAKIPVRFKQFFWLKLFDLKI